jgi:hypothetical protein
LLLKRPAVILKGEMVKRQELHVNPVIAQRSKLPAQFHPPLSSNVSCRFTRRSLKQSRCHQPKKFHFFTFSLYYSELKTNKQETA